MVKRLLAIMLCILLISPYAYARSFEYGDTDTAGNNEWVFDSDGDQIPVDDSARYLGETGSELAGIVTDGITLAGVTKTSWPSASGVSWTSNGTDTSLEGNASVYITESTGVMTATGLDIGASDIVLENDQTIDGGTNNAIILGDNSDTLNIAFDGDDTSITCSDGSIEIIPETSTADGTIALMSAGDTDDYVEIIHTAANLPSVNFKGCDGIISADGGDISFSNENLATTGTLACAAFTGSSTGSFGGTVTLQNSETIVNSSDGTVEIKANAGETILRSEGIELSDGILQIVADDGDDQADIWEFESDASTNDLFIKGGATSSTLVTIQDSTGNITTAGDAIVVNDDATTDAVGDVAYFRHTSTGTPAVGLGVGVVFDVEDAGGSEEQASIDVVLKRVTDGDENADIVIKQNVTGTMVEVLSLLSSLSATSATKMRLSTRTDETNGVVDIAEFRMISTGTPAAGLGSGLSVQIEDAGGLEEQASLDFKFTTTTDGSEDVDIAINQNVNGTISERIIFDADGANMIATGTTPYITIGDSDKEDTKLVFDGNITDYYVALDDTGGASEDLFTIGVGSTVGTAPRITIDSSANVSLIGSQIVTATNIVDATRCVTFYPGSFLLTDSTKNIAQLSTTTTPGLEIENNSAAIVFSDGEASRASVTFQVPSWYVSGGGFRAGVAESTNATSTAIDYQVYVNRNGRAFDNAVTDQTTVAVGGVAGQLYIATMTITTDFAGLQADDMVTFDMWSDWSGSNSADLELFWLQFFGRADQ